LEKVFEIKGISPVEFFGVNNSLLQVLKRYFPTLKIVSRGNSLTAIGDEEVLNVFETKLNQLIDYFHRFNQLNENAIEQIVLEDISTKQLSNGDEVLVHGTVIHEG
jgi:phosphate starvation-inducible PhoH-like protein